MQRFKALFTLSVLLAAFSPFLGDGAQAQEADPVNQTDDPILRDFVWRSIGPANMS